MIDRGPSHTTIFPCYRHGTQYGEDLDASTTLENVMSNLTSLTNGILKTNIEDLLEAVQQHIVEVPIAWVHVFRRVDTMLMYYHSIQGLGDP